MDGLEWLETASLPQVCQRCMESECYNCDHAGARWGLATVDELQLRRKGLLKTIERLQRNVAKLDKEIADFCEK